MHYATMPSNVIQNDSRCHHVLGGGAFLLPEGDKFDKGKDILMSCISKEPWYGDRNQIR